MRMWAHAFNVTAGCGSSPPSEDRATALATTHRFFPSTSLSAVSMSKPIGAMTSGFVRVAATCRRLKGAYTPGTSATCSPIDAARHAAPIPMWGVVGVPQPATAGGWCRAICVSGIACEAAATATRDRVACSEVIPGSQAVLRRRKDAPGARMLPPSAETLPKALATAGDAGWRRGSGSAREATAAEMMSCRSGLCVRCAAPSTGTMLPPTTSVVGSRRPSLPAACAHDGISGL
mmetsp:Transcript_20976/g.65201  ORF Transcript_20976/g.65201 Transcript_20976/m.65201 type:complete len:234 (+) Transcript_20976:932-1633(+)